VAELERQGRLFYETDPLQVARLLDKGIADVTILTPMSLAHEMKEDRRVRHLLERLRIEEMPELPWGYSGAYISTRSLSPQDQRYLAAQLREGFKADAVWAEYRRYYPANVVAASRKPR
jgi:polar amino acid transport system substrate-binding protein